MDEMEISTISGDKINPAAILVRDAYKRYNTAASIVLRGLNMTVPDGTIYGLLGPSGCGKTTLLSCVVGRVELDSGSVFLKAKRRKEIGYMPQDLTLHPQLSIYETFKFYGYAFGMNDVDISHRAIDMISFLDLPSGYRDIKSLSGGQQRRVSLAVTLLHDPNLLILDEPTVGLDPVLSQSIWIRLLDMAKRGKSIVITTHYIEEARQAHTIGLMRGGVLLAEQPPNALMAMCNANNLEEAFLTLSHQQEALAEKEIKVIPERKPIQVQYQDDEKFFSYTKYKSVMYKNVTLLKRETIFLAFVIILPLLQTYLFNVAIGHRPLKMSIAIVNEEMTGLCNQMSYSGCFLDNPHNTSLSCLYLEHLRNKSAYNLVEYANNEIALSDVRKNKAWGLMHFEKNFTAALANRIELGRRADDWDVQYSDMATWIDLSNQYIGNLIRADVLISALEFMRHALINCKLSPKIATPPLVFEDPIYGTTAEDFISYAATSIVCLCCFFFPSILTAGLILTEKIDGIIERMMVAGVTVIEMVASVVVIQLFVHMMQTALVVFVMYVSFGNPQIGDWYTLIALLMIIGLCGTFFGLLLAVMNEMLSMCAYIGICSNICLCFTSGLVWPVEGEHYLLRSISWMFPLTLTANAARAITHKAFTLAHPVVWLGFVSIIVWNVIFIIGIYAAIKWKKDVWGVKK